MERSALRLELLKVLLPSASRHGLENDGVIEIARKLENYVVESAPEKSIGEEQPASPNRETLSLPRKDKQDPGVPEFLTPPVVDKSSKNRR